MDRYVVSWFDTTEKLFKREIVNSGDLARFISVQMARNEIYSVNVRVYIDDEEYLLGQPENYSSPTIEDSVPNTTQSPSIRKRFR